MVSEPPSAATTLAVILGASKFPKHPNLANSKAFLNSAASFKEYLLDKSGLGITSENVLDLFDCDEASSDLDEMVAAFLEQRQQDLSERNQRARDLIVYYVGHGGFSRPGNEYFLAIRKTRVSNEGPSSYSIKALANTLRESATHLRRYVILDSCFSSAVHEAFQSAPLLVARTQTVEELPPKGTAILCAAGPRDPAKTLANQSFTMFSESFLEALRVGNPEVPGKLSFWEISEITRNLIKNKFPSDAVRPEMHSPDQKFGDLARMPFFPNQANRDSVVTDNHVLSLSVEWPISDKAYVWPLANRLPEFKLFELMITGQSKRRTLLLRGSSNSGKTACISELAAYAKHLNISSALVDFKGTPSLEDIFEMLRLDLGSDVLRRSVSVGASARFVELISDLQQVRVPLVLFFDTYQQASAEAQRWVENRFLPRMDRAPGIVAVVGGQMVPSRQAMTELRVLEPIKKVQDWVDFIGRKWQKADIKVDYVKALTLSTKGEPGVMSALLETMILELEKGTGD